MHEVLIIGAGPAGVSAALYAARSNIANITIVSDGSSSLKRAGMIENYYGFDTPVSGAELLEKGIAGAERLGVRIVKDEIVDIQIDPGMRFSVSSSSGMTGTYDAVMIATGVSRKSPGIKGLKELEGKGVSYCAVCDGFFYKNKNVAVIGSGRYAVNEASALSDIASQVYIISNGDEIADGIPENISVIDKEISSIDGSDRVEAVSFRDGTRLEVSGAFIAMGTAGSGDLARKTGAPVENNRIIVNEKMETAVPGLFAGGDCTGGLMQISKAVYDGAQAGLSIVRFLKSR